MHEWVRGGVNMHVGLYMFVFLGGWVGGCGGSTLTCVTRSQVM